MKRFEAGDAIVVFQIEPANVATPVEIDGWYCGMKDGLHVYLLQTEVGIAKCCTPMVEMCHAADLEEHRRNWNAILQTQTH